MTNKTNSGKIGVMHNNTRLMKMLRMVPVLFTAVVLSGFLSSGLIIFQSMELSRVIDQVFLGGKTLEFVRSLILAILAIILIRGLFTFLNDALGTMVAVRIKSVVRNQLLSKIERLGPSYLRLSQCGELVTSAIQGVDAIDAYFSQYLPQIIIAVLMPLTILAVVFPLDLVSGLVFLVTAPLLPFFMVLVGKSSEAQTRKQWTALSRLGASFLDTLQGLTTLKTLGRSKTYAGHVAEVSDRYRAVTMTVLRITFLSAFVLELLATISTAVVAVEIGLRLLYGRLLFEQAFFILLMAPEFYLPMRNLGMRYHAGMTGVTAASRIFEVLDLPEPETVWKTPEEQKKLRMDEPIFIRFKRVGFIYPHNSQNSIKSVDLLIESGRHYALVGRSGAGKSTLLQLLMGFLVPTAGRITVNDIDLRMVDHREWRKRIAWVPQSPMIFNVSLLENVRLENEDISEGRVWEALRMAQLADFARELPQGLETPLGEWGVRLSGGQVQRVALARAFVKDAPFIFMDEPTAHLDPILEQSLRVSTGELLKGRTSVVIAHRLATVRDADSILVIEGGRIVESGIHEELMAMKGYYSGLFLSQEGGS